MYDRATVENNFKYHKPDEDAIIKHQAVRIKAREFALWITMEVPVSPERTLALRKLEETVMWANAAIARNKLADNGYYHHI